MSMLLPLLCRTCLLYASPSTQQALQHQYDEACTLRHTWKGLIELAGTVDWSLSDTKLKFSETTRQQVDLRLCCSATLLSLLHDDLSEEPHSQATKH